MRTKILFFLMLFISLEAASETISYEYEGVSLTYEIKYNYAKVTGCPMTAENVVIPSTVKNYPVTSIGDFAFQDCSGLTSITIPNSVTSIGGAAFRRCSGLTSVTIPNSVTLIDDCTFQECISLTSVTIPNSVTSIGYSAFKGCINLTSVLIPNSVTEIDRYAFQNCSSLTSLIVEDGDSKLEIFPSLFEGAPISDLYIGRDWSTPWSNTFFPKTIVNLTFGNRITCIPSSAFQGCSNLTSVTISNSVTSIGDLAFQGCSGLTSVSIPNSVTSIGNSAFQGCSNLTSVTISNSVTSIGNSAFQGCSNLTSLEIPNKVNSIGKSAFADCPNLAEITLKDGHDILIFGENVFTNSDNIETLHVGRDFSYTGGYTSCGPFFNKSNLTNISFSDSVSKIVIGAFQECVGIKNCQISNSITAIGNYAFYNCSGLTDLEIPNSVTTIGTEAFYGCCGLRTVIIGNSVTSVGTDAFSGCTGLIKSFYPNQLANPFKNGVASTNSDRKPIIIDNGWVYSEDSTSIYFAPLDLEGNYMIPASTNTISGYAFSLCTNLTDIDIPNSVTMIGNSAFSNCSELSDITIEDGNTTLKFDTDGFSGSDKIKSIYLGRNFGFNGNSPFYKKNSITNITLSDCVDNIPSGAFKECIGIKNIQIPNSVTTISDYAFSGCSGIVSVTIPNSVTTIGNYAFSNCSGLKSILIAPQVKPAKNAFSNCNPIKLVTSDKLDVEDFTGIPSECYYARYVSDNYYIDNNCLYNLDNTMIGYVPCDIADGFSMPETIEHIGSLAFTGCANIQSLTIPSSVKLIDDYAFEGCTNLKTINAEPINIPAVEESGGMSELYSETELVVPFESTIDYASTLPWSNFLSIKTSTGNKVLSGTDDVFKYVYLPATKEAALISCLNSSMPIVNIPRRVVFNVDGDESFYNLTRIGEEAFKNHSMNTVAIGNNVREIGKSAFAECKQLNNIEFGENVELIGEEAFTECTALLNIKFNDNLKYIDRRAFAKCNYLNAIEFNEGLERIEAEAFTECFSMHISTNIVLNKNLKYLGAYAFANCSNIYSVESNGSLEKINCGAFYNCNSLKNINIKDGMKSIGDSAFAKCRAIDDIILPSTLEEIGEYAFSYMYERGERVSDYGYNPTFPEDDQYINNINIPASVKRIGKGAFNTTLIKRVNIESLEAWCNISFDDKYSNPMIYCSAPMTVSNKEITDLVIPDNITKINNYTFICNNFNSITIPQNVTSIDKYAFLSQCEMTTVKSNTWGNYYYNYNYDTHTAKTIPHFVIEDGYNEIEFTNSRFLGCTQSEFYLGRNINGRLAGGQITNLKIGNYVTEIPDNCCSGNSNLNEVSFGSSVKSIGINAFKGSRVSNIKLPALLKSIGSNAFSGTRLTNVVIPPSVETIGNNAFADCNLKTIAIGCGIKEIGETAFSNSNSISDVYVTALNPPTANNNSFSNYNPTLHVPASVKNDYLDFPRCWYRFENNVSILDLAERIETNVTRINDARPGDTYQLTAQVYPAQALQHVFWQSTDPSIALVDVDGKVTICDPETAPEITITPTVTASAGSDAACEIHAYTLYDNGPVAVVKIYGDLSGIENVEADPHNGNSIDWSAPYEVYNLSGMMLGDSTDGLRPGIYIVRQSNRAEKISVR